MGRGRGAIDHYKNERGAYRNAKLIVPLIFAIDENDHLLFSRQPVLIWPLGDTFFPYEDMHNKFRLSKIGWP